MTDMFDKSEIELELQKSRERKNSLLLSLGNILDSLGGNHIRWLMAISAGFVIWLVSAIEQFSIEKVLFWKWLYIVILSFQMFSTVVFFGVNGILFQLSLKLNLLKTSGDCPAVQKKEKEFMGKIEKRLPGSIVTLAEITFILSFVLFAIYIITFIILHR